MTASRSVSPRPRPPYSCGIGMPEHAELGAGLPGARGRNGCRDPLDHVAREGGAREGNGRLMELLLLLGKVGEFHEIPSPGGS